MGASNAHAFKNPRGGGQHIKTIDIVLCSRYIKHLSTRNSLPVAIALTRGETIAFDLLASWAGPWTHTPAKGGGLARPQLPRFSTVCV